MQLYLGIDGGQSSTTALIAGADGRVLGAGHAGPCNHVGEAQRRAKFISAVGGSVREAARQAGVPERFTAVCAGFSGGAADKDALTRELIRAEHYLVTHDAHIALTGATAGAPGIIVIAGTGSIAYGRNSRRQEARAGGWGYIFGDEGGAFDLVRQALRAALRHEEGWGPPTALHAVLLEATGAASASELLHLFYTPRYPREAVAALAPRIDAAARMGDAVAASLLDQAAHALATLAAAVQRQLFGEGDHCTIHYTGGMFSSAPMLARFQMLCELSGAARVLPPALGPAHGALLEAQRIARAA